MKCILDTHTLLWIVTDDPRLGRNAKRIYLDKENDICLSLASIWELAIKSSLSRLSFGMTLEEFVEEHVFGNAIDILYIGLGHVIRIEQLPFHHRDPFDRMIISQALEENLVVLGGDPLFDGYGVNRLW
jgi:PIN domain nuclease of toxin-antitoxin system